VGFVVEMQANHVFHHIKQILAIRQDHRLTPAGADGANRDGVQVVQPRKKALRPLATRTPPAPSESHADIEEWIRGVMPNLCPIVTHLDALIRDTIPGLQYAVKWKKAYYGLPGRGWIIEVAAYDVSANVVFFGGAEFNSPPPLGEGSRYVKVRTLEEAQGAELLAWIQQSGRVAGWK
jgi:hypothetical protein